MPNILFLSDNPLLQADLTNQIETVLPEYKVTTTDDNETVLDIALLDGKKFLEQFRQKHAKVPALIFDSSENSEYTENNLNTIVYKPIVLATLLNQIKSSINVFANSTEGVLHFGSYELHPEDKTLVNLQNKQIIKLTEREISIIRYLYKSANKLVSKEELLENVWEYSAETTTHTIETHIYRLRKKLEQENTAAPLIVAEDGGYRLER